MSKGFHEAIRIEPGRLFPLAGGLGQRSGRFSGWLGRSLAQVIVAGSRGKGQSPGDFDGSALVDAVPHLSRTFWASFKSAVNDASTFPQSKHNLAFPGLLMRTHRGVL